MQRSRGSSGLNWKPHFTSSGLGGCGWVDEVCRLGVLDEGRSGDDT